MEPRKLQPGDSPDHPLPATPPDEIKEGRRYEGWNCSNDLCSKRVELGDAISATPSGPTEEIWRVWVKCAHCATVDLYRMDGRTTKEY